MLYKIKHPTNLYDQRNRQNSVKGLHFHANVFHFSQSHQGVPANLNTSVDVFHIR